MKKKRNRAVSGSGFHDYKIPWETRTRSLHVGCLWRAVINSAYVDYRIRNLVLGYYTEEFSDNILSHRILWQTILCFSLGYFNTDISFCVDIPYCVNIPYRPSFHTTLILQLCAPIVCLCGLWNMYSMQKVCVIMQSAIIRM